jgi:hypothetical protein
MHRPNHKMMTIIFALLFAVVATEALADGSRNYGSRSYGNGNHGSRHHGSRHHGSYSNYPRLTRSYHGSYTNYGYSYPSRGYATYNLPYGYRTVHHHGSPYYYHGGSWYRPYGPRFVVVAPPFGIGVSVLPPYYSTLWYGGSPYYYADSTYYAYRPERREYVVTEPPPGAQVESRVEDQVEEKGSNEIFVYPRDGQSEEQQATDRYECHRWAADRTGFDPTRPAGNVAETDMTSKRVDYRRAESACLEGRGYTVR